VEGHVFSTLSNRKFLIAEPSDVTNIDVMMFLMGGHVYSTLISRKILILKSFCVIKSNYNICEQVDCQHLIIECHCATLLFIVMIYKHADRRHLVIRAYPSCTVDDMGGNGHR
jgi:hypothetical protein